MNKPKRKLKILPVAMLTLFTLLLFVAAVVIIITHRDRPLPMEYSEIISKYSAENNIPEHIIYAVIYTESSFEPDAVSKAGAVGLMQLLPATAEWLCQREGVEFDDEMLTNPDFGICYGTKYLKILYDRYQNWDATHAAYHAGFTRVDAWLEEEIVYYDENGQLEGIPIEATENYVNKLRDIREKYFKQLEEKKENE